MNKLINPVGINVPETPDAGVGPAAAADPDHRTRFKVQEAEDIVDAMSPAGAINPALAAELVALDLIVARIGGMVAAYRIKRRVIEELRTGPRHRWGGFLEHRQPICMPTVRRKNWVDVWRKFETLSRRERMRLIRDAENLLRGG